MTEKIEKRQDQQPKPDKKKARKFPKMTKKFWLPPVFVEDLC